MLHIAPEPAPAALDRRSYIGSSDASDILHGRWLKPWRFKTGRQPEDDLSRNFRVQLGVHTEPFHIAWILGGLAETGSLGSFQALEHQFLKAPGSDFIAAHPDQLLVTERGAERIPVEVKHTSGRKSMEEILAYYMPQLQHHLYCADASRLLFSAILGNDEPVMAWVGASGPWFDAIEAAYPAFWKHVVDDVAPEGEQPFDLEGAPIPPPPSLNSVPLNGLVARDASTDNAFTVWCAEYVETRDAAQRHEKAKGELKSLVAPNEREVFNPVLSIKRDARGALRFTVKKD